MTLTLAKTIPAAALAILGYALIASSAQASVTSQLNKCRYDTKLKVVECCERVLRDEKKPIWMIESGRNCNSAAICIGKPARGGRLAISYVAAPKKNKKCFIKIQNDTIDNGRDVPEIKAPDRPQRGGGFNPARG